MHLGCFLLQLFPTLQPHLQNTTHDGERKGVQPYRAFYGNSILILTGRFGTVWQNTSPHHADFCAAKELFRAHIDYPTGTICRECIWGCCYIIFIFPTTFCYYSISKHRPHRVFTLRSAKCIRLIISSNDVHAVYIVYDCFRFNTYFLISRGYIG